MPLGVWERLTKACATCGKEFRVKRSTMDRQKFCSFRCRNQGQWGSECQEPNWNCAICGKADHVTPFWQSRKRTCSWECRNKYLSITRMGENGTNWKGGVALIARYIRSSKTMKNWIREVLESNGGVCAECTSAPATEAHHIVQVSELLAKMFDPANGLPLCNECHAHVPGHNANFVKRPRQAATPEE